MSDWLIDAGKLAAAITAIVGCLGIVARSRVGRWLAEKVTEDLSEKRRAEIREELQPIWAELTPNSGKSLRDVVENTRDLIQEHVGDQTLHRAAPSHAGWQGPPERKDFQ